MGHIQSGRLRALAVTSRLRSRVLPDLPTVDEAGLKLSTRHRGTDATRQAGAQPPWGGPAPAGGYEVLEWNPVLAPAGLPADVKAKLGGALRKAMADPEVLGRVRALGGEVFEGGAPQAQAFLQAQQVLWSGVVRERHITRE